VTLKVTILTPNVIYQSADFRLVNFQTGKVITDRSAKTVTLTYWSWDGFITYTGVGRWRGRDVSELIAEWLTGVESPSMTDVADIVAAKGTELLRYLEKLYASRMRHTFTLVGFEGGQARVCVISNFEDCRNKSKDTIDDYLTVTTRGLRKSERAIVIVTGRKKAVPLSERRMLGSVAAQYPEDSLRVRRRLEKLNRAAASSPDSGGAISEDCLVVSFRADGTGAMQLNRDATEVPPLFPEIANGINTGKLLQETFKGLGVDPSQMRLLQAGFGRGRPADAPTTAPPAGPCRYAIRIPDPTSGYRLSEITATEFGPVIARDISDQGQIVGTGQADGPQPRPIPWSWHGGVMARLNYTGATVAVNGLGQIVASQQLAPGANRVAIYEKNTLTELPPYRDESGAFSDSTSIAYSINDQTIVSGEVHGDREDPRQPVDMRAAIFHPDKPAIIFEGFVFKFGARAVDINEHGHVLIDANPGAFDARSVLWDPSTGSWGYVGDERTYVYPVSLNDEGFVLGLAKNTYGHPVAAICEPGCNWKRLGTRDGWEPLDMNNRGEVIGRGMIDSLFRPWLRRPTGEVVLLPYLSDHHTYLTSINNRGQIVGSANADRCSHAILWDI
jgi:hypothetical protein